MKYAGVLLSLLITIGMSMVMSFAMTVVNTGFEVGFMLRWLEAWMISVVVAFPAAAVIIPAARKLTNRILGSSDEHQPPLKTQKDNGHKL